MNDDAKAAVEWLRKVVTKTSHGITVLDLKQGQALLAHIDGEPARIAAAVADASSAALRAMSRAVKAEVRVAELERTLKERDEQSLFEGQREHEWNASFNATVIERAEKAEAERDMLQTALRDNSAAHSETGKMLLRAEAERDALRAQVEAARTYARQALDYGEDCDATDLLAAMDEAKP